MRGISSAVVLPGGLVIPAGLDPVMADLIGQVNSPDHAAWMGQVARIGGCANPLHLRGFTRVRDSATGRVDYEFDSREAPGGVVLVRCRNRREAVCSSCARLYQGDIYHLVRAGLEGGKGVPESVAEHPRVFATLTAPSFGAVHTYRPSKNKTGRGRLGVCHPRRSGECEHGRPTACFARHREDDPLPGTPLCSDCYDYRGAVVWQASVGKLWARFITYLPRVLGTVGGMSREDVTAEVRFSFVKIVEYQRRGLVHIHAVIRADGVPSYAEEDAGRAVIAPPEWVTASLIGQAVKRAAAGVRVEIDAGSVGWWALGWGTELDVHDITGRFADQSAGKVAAYVAKYSSKSTEVTGWDFSSRPDTPRAVHAAAMVRAAFALAEVPELAELKLGRWGKALAYRGHVSSKSRRYSTTLGALRQARAQHRIDAGQTLTPGGDNLVVESAWELVGHGYSPGQAVLAADVARDIALNRAAAREAGGARPRAGGRDSARRDDGVRERGARVAPGGKSLNRVRRGPRFDNEESD